MVFGELGAGVYGVFLALELPGVFPILAFAKAGGLVAQNGKEGNRFVIDKGVDEAQHVEGGVFGIEFADLQEVRIFAGDVGEFDGGDEGRVGDLGGDFSGIVHAAIEVKVAF